MIVEERCMSLLVETNALLPTAHPERNCLEAFTDHRVRQPTSQYPGSLVPARSGDCTNVVLYSRAFVLSHPLQHLQVPAHSGPNTCPLIPSAAKLPCPTYTLNHIPKP